MLNKCKSLFLFLALFASASLFAQAPDQEKDLRTLVTLLDYISKDYAVAVSNGQIVNEGEYAEMTEFAQKCINLQQELSPSINKAPFSELQPTLAQLAQAIADKKEQPAIAAIALNTKNTILSLQILKITPDKYPSLKNGAALYAATCVPCHGSKGLGDGQLSKGMEPAPANFHEAAIAPLQAYNVIKLGIEGTQMASYAHLSESELWDLSFYVLTLKHQQATTSLAQLPAALHLDSISRWNDTELHAFLAANAKEVSAAQVRHFEPLRPAPLDVASENLELAHSLFLKGDPKLAEKHALTFYLEGIELVENILSAADPKLVLSIEQNMLAYRKAIQSNDAANEASLYTQLKTQVATAKSLLANKDYSFAFIYGSALSLLIREALEALLIILIVLSVLRPLDAKKAILAVHAGWLSALLVGVMSWFFVDKLINLSGASRELMEGVGAAIAVVVLLFAGVWLHSHSEVTKWTAFLKEKIHQLSASGSWLGLFAFSFLVVFREAFEVVLFLSSLKLNNPAAAGPAINWALLTAVGVMSVIAFIFLRYTKKLPIGQFFKIAAYMIALLTIVLTGKAIKAFQETGHIPTSPIESLPQIDLLGFFPNMQSILAQILIFAVIVFFTLRSQPKPQKA